MPDSGRVLLALLACCGALVLAGAIGAAGAPGDSAGPTAAAQGATSGAGEPTSVGQAQPEADATVIRVAVASNGSARWTLEVRTRLRTDDAVAEFEAFQEPFRANRSEHRESFRERMAGVAESASADTGRGMTVGDPQATTTIEQAPQRWGVVRLSVRWDGFAGTERSRLTVGDAFGSGFYIGEDTVLHLDLPDGYDVESTQPVPDDRDGTHLAWHGPRDFEDDRPRVVAASDAPRGRILAGGALLALLVAAAAAWYRDLYGCALVALGWSSGASGGAVGSRGDDGASTGGGVASAGTAPEDPPPLADEDRVERLLRERGGRCRQSEIVETLDWSKSKTSRVLSRMADDGTVEKRRIGRENVVELVAGD